MALEVRNSLVNSLSAVLAKVSMQDLSAFRPFVVEYMKIFFAIQMNLVFFDHQVCTAHCALSENKATALRSVSGFI